MRSELEFNGDVQYGEFFEYQIFDKAKTELGVYTVEFNPDKMDPVKGKKFGDLFIYNTNHIKIACWDTKRSMYFSIPSIVNFEGFKNKRHHRALYLFLDGIVTNSEIFQQYIYRELCKTFSILNLEKLSMQEAGDVANRYVRSHHNIDLGKFIRMHKSGDLGFCYFDVPAEFVLYNGNWKDYGYWAALRRNLRY